MRYDHWQIVIIRSSGNFGYATMLAGVRRNIFSEECRGRALLPVCARHRRRQRTFGRELASTEPDWRRRSGGVRWLPPPAGLLTPGADHVSESILLTAASQARPHESKKRRELVHMTGSRFYGESSSRSTSNAKAHQTHLRSHPRRSSGATIPVQRQLRQRRSHPGAGGEGE